VHLTAGYLYWKEHRFDYNAIHPPLANILNAIPLLFYRSLKLPVLKPDIKNEWAVSEDFLYRNTLDAEKMLNQSRLVTLLLSCMLGWLIFYWSKKMFSLGGGIISLLLFAFSPNILAHSRLVTTDLTVTFFIFLSTYFFWEFINYPSLRTSLTVGISLGLALATKYSALILLPLYLCLIGIHRRKLLRYSLPLLIIALLTLTSCYGFTHFPWYFHGLKVLYENTHQGWLSFLHGNYRIGGWWFYFPFLFFTKTPLTLLLLLPLSLFFLIKQKKKILSPLIIPASYFMVAIFSRIQIGARHFLPIYPFLFLFCGSLGNMQIPRKLKNLILVLLFLYPLNSLLIFPHYLAYFNGLLLPSRAYKWVADSNIDWGQDLKGLKKWMDKEKIPSLYLGYYGTASPSYYKISYRYLPSSTAHLDRYYYHSIPEAREVIAISVTTYHGLYGKDFHFYQWLHRYKPFSSIGYSILLFDITRDPYAHLNLGINYYRSMLFREAKEEFERVLEIEPKNSIAWFNLGKVYEIMGDKDEARKHFEKALKFAPKIKRKKIKDALER